MSTCVSMHGEYSDHVPNDEFICARCNVLDEAALIEDRYQLRTKLAERDATIAQARAALRGAGFAPRSHAWRYLADIERALDAP